MAKPTPYPRQLTTKETLDTLTHWRSHVRTYFKREEDYKPFFVRTCRWNYASQDYGFTGEGAAEKACNLESLLDTIAGFLPGPYLASKITQKSKCIDDVFTFIWTHYDVHPSQSSFLDINKICLDKEECYVDLYWRLLYHQEQHVTGAGVKVEDVTLTRDETVNNTHRNLIV